MCSEASRCNSNRKLAIRRVNADQSSLSKLLDSYRFLATGGLLKSGINN